MKRETWMSKFRGEAVMSALFSFIVFGNSIGLFEVFLGSVLLGLGIVFIITVDGYDMRNDVIMSLREKGHKKS